MKVRNSHRITSGDLLVIHPKNDYRERLYSIGMVSGKLQLSVKLHQHGLGSGFLHNLKNGQTIKGRILKNLHFHFPRNATQVIMISNGTGIAPFLGMIDENRKKLPCVLYCGFRTNDSFALYKNQLMQQQNKKKLTGYHLALSREGNKSYVSHLLQRDEALIGEAISGGAVIMICGSLAMQKEVMFTLKNICMIHGGNSIETYKHAGKILTDCY